MKFFIIALVIDLCFALYNFWRIMQMTMVRDRGTNTFTRFVRDVSSNADFSITSFTCVGFSILIMLIATFTGNYAGILSALPTLGVAFYAFIQQKQSTQNKQRVKDARQVTASTGEAVGNSVVIAGQVASNIYGVDKLVDKDDIANVCAGLGNAVKKTTALEGTTQMGLMDKADCNANDFYSLNTDKLNLAALNGGGDTVAIAGNVMGALDSLPSRQPIEPAETIATLTPSLPSYTFDSEAFRNAASQYGFTTEERSDEEVAGDILKFAPQPLVAYLGDSMSDIEKADRIIRGLT